MNAEPTTAASPVDAILSDEVRLREASVEPPEVEIIEDFLAEPRIEVAADRPQAGDAISAVESRLGSEGLSRLRARHSEVLARIAETIADPQRQDELKSQAERLNPDTWVTDGEVSAGLEGYEAVLESLRAVVGQGRRRRRRGGQVRESSPADPASPLVDNAGTAIESGPPAASAEGQDDDAEPEEEPV
jgi:hypothetical protein